MMKAAKFAYLVERIAFEAIRQGMDVSLERKEYIHDSRGIGKSIGGGHTEDTGVIFRAFQQEIEHEEEVKDEKQGEERPDQLD